MRYLPGDILFYKVTPQSRLVSRILAAGDLLFGGGRSSMLYSHVALVEDSEHQIEALWPRVRRSRIDWSNHNIEVWRVLNADQRRGVGAAAWAASQIGRWYDILSILIGWHLLRHATICTKLVVDSWQSQGMAIYPQTDRLLTMNELASGGRIRLLQRRP